VLAGRENRRGAVPLVGEVEDRVDIVAGGEGPKPVDCGGIDRTGRPGRQMSHLLTDTAHLEPVGERPEGG
jgi:hypothetical protein